MFEALLEKLDLLGKESLKKAEDTSTDEVLGEVEGEVDDAVDGAVNGDELIKSFVIKDASGVEYEAIDGTEMAKAMMSRIDGQGAEMLKCMETLTEILTGQDKMLKSLSEELHAIQASGRGRKSVVSVAEKPEAVLQKSTPETMPPREFLMKALQAQRDGKVAGSLVCEAETAINLGQAVPPHIVAKVLA